MSKIIFLVICAIDLVMLGVSSMRQRKRLLVEPYDNRLGIRFAKDSFIQQYENEHKMMHRKDGIKDEAKYTKWPRNWGDKYVTEFCEKYLNAIIPGRNIRNMFGIVEQGRILYSHESDDVEYCNIGVIKCEIPIRNPRKRGKCYYITEAPERVCVYSLMHKTRGTSPFKIVSKICGFENNYKPNRGYFKNPYKEKIKIHKRTGIPIASRDRISEYEHKHLAMYKKDDGSIDTGKYKAWPLKQNKTYLTEFCAKYLHAVVPNRVKQKNLLGERDLFELEYTHNNRISLEIGIIKCHVVPIEGMKTDTFNYYITESPEPDCVYTLLRQTQASVCMIVYLICNMKIVDDDVKDWVHNPVLNTLENMDFNNVSNNRIENCELKPDLKTLSLFPKD